MDRYLADISRMPLLTPAEEIDLGRKVQRMRALRDEAKARELTQSEAREMRMGQKAADRFVRANLRLVVSVAKRYGGLRHLALEDIIQEASIGLMRAVELFDPTRGYRFSTYAYGWCQQAISRAIVTKEKAMRLPGRVGDMAARWSKSMSRLMVELGRSPTLEELAEEHRVSVDDVRLYLARGVTVASLDATVNSDGEGTFLEFVRDEADPYGTAAAERIDEELRAQVVRDALARLDERERHVLEARYLGAADKAPSFGMLGNAMGVSRSRVAQLEQVAANKMKRLVWDLRDHETLCL